MSETNRDRAQSEQTEDTVETVIDADTPIDPPEDVVAEESAYTSQVMGQGMGQAVEEAEVIAAPEEKSNVVPAVPAVQSAGASTGSMIIGGVIAAAIGAAATLVFLPEGWRPVNTAALESRIAAVEGVSGGLNQADLAAALTPLSDRIAALETADPTADLADRITALEAVDPPARPDLSPLTDRIAALEGAGLDMSAVNAALAPLSTRIALIEGSIAEQARVAVEAALADARAEVEAQAAALTSREGSVEAAQARIAARAALAELIAAAESGEPQPGALATLAAETEIPAALAPFADGLMTLAGLQEAFAPAARAALDAEAPPPDAPMSDRVMNFLRSQTGARSLAPRDGDDTDAVLSRAEASLRDGDIPATLAELDALSGAPAEAMASWRAQAEHRLAALAALTTLQDQFTANEG